MTAIEFNVFQFHIVSIAVFRFVPVEKMIERAESIAPYVQQTLDGGRSQTSTVSERGYHIRVALAIFADHPIIGAGYGGYGPLFLRYQRDVPGSPLIYKSARSAHGTVWSVSPP